MERIGNQIRLLKNRGNRGALVGELTANGRDNFIPHVLFDANGSLSGLNEEVINLARGSIFYQRDASGALVDVPDVREAPLGDSINNYNRIRINGLTGRAKVERPEIQ